MRWIIKLAQNALHQNLSQFEMRLEYYHYRNSERRNTSRSEQSCYSKRISGGIILKPCTVDISPNNALTLAWQPLGSLQLVLTWLKKLEDPRTRYGLFAAYPAYPGYWTSGSLSICEPTQKFAHKWNELQLAHSQWQASSDLRGFLRSIYSRWLNSGPRNVCIAIFVQPIIKLSLDEDTYAANTGP